MSAKRLPGKPLLKIKGKSIIVHVFNKAKKCGIGRVVVATEDIEIVKEIKKNKGFAVLTSKKHQSGTDRIAEAAIDIDCDIVVNLQGDEPFINKIALEELIKSFDDPKVKMASLMTKFKSFNEINNPNNVKVNIYNRPTLRMTLETFCNFLLLRKVYIQNCFY